MDAYTDRLSDYLDSSLELPARVELEGHLASCGECTQALRELRRVKERAARLADREPATDLWHGISAHLGDERRAAPVARPRTFSFSAAQLLAASLTLVVLSGTGAWLVGRGRPAPAMTATITDSAPAAGGSRGANVIPASLPSDRALGITAYDSAVADLHRVLDAGRGRLRPQTIRVLEDNLAAIDRAISDARRALRDDPESAPFLDGYLQQQMKRKLDLMKRAAAIASGASDD
jgi:hypothetical protein